MRFFLTIVLAAGCGPGLEEAEGSPHPAEGAAREEDGPCVPLPLVAAWLEPSKICIGGPMTSFKVAGIPLEKVGSCHANQLLEALEEDHLCVVAHVLLLKKATEIPPEIRALRGVSWPGWGVHETPDRKGHSCDPDIDYRSLWGDVGVMADAVRPSSETRRSPRPRRAKR